MAKKAAWKAGQYGRQLVLTNLLDELGIPYVIGGSMASIIHGMLRTTMDADIVADIQPEQVSSFVSGLQDAFYADEQMIQIRPDSDEQIWVLSAEDIVLAKLDWFRLGGEVSERQWRDILGVLKTQQEALDINYLKQWAQSLDVADLMQRALEELTED